MLNPSTVQPSPDYPPKRTRRRWVWVCGILIFLIGGLFWLNQPLFAPFVLDPPLETGLQAPAFQLQSPAGESIALSQFRGKPVVLNFWASWCGPCVDEMPELQALWDEYQGEVVVIAVNQGERIKAVQRFQQEHPELSFHFLMDSNKSVNRQYQVDALPTTYFIDEKGVIQAVHMGAPLGQRATESLTRILEAHGGL